MVAHARSTARVENVSGIINEIMSFRWPIPVVIFAACSMFAQTQQSPVPVRCTVVNAVTHQPVAGAEVTLTDLSGATTAVQTNSAGMAETQVLARTGPLLATAKHDAYVPIRYDSYYPFEGAQLVRTAGDKASACVLRLKPRGALAGVVTSPQKLPLKGITVTALWRTYQSGKATYIFAAETHSAADGTFRLPQLLPGLYILRAAPEKRVHTGEERIRATFFPFAADASSATPIRLPAGTSVDNITFEMQSTTPVSVTFRITSTTRRLLNDEVTIMRGINDFSRMFYPADCCATLRVIDERLSLPDVPSGTYTFKITANVDGKEEEGFVSVTLGTKPNPVVDVALTRPQQLVAKAVRKGSERTPHLQLMVVLMPLDQMINRVVGAQTNSADLLVFEELKPGAYEVGISGMKSDEYAEIWVNGQLVPGDILEIPPSVLPSVEIRIREGAGSVEVVAEDCEVCIGTTLVIFPGTPGPARTIKGTDYGCRFTMKGLRPGEYEVALVRDMEQGEAADTLFRSKLSDVKKIEIGGSQQLRMTTRVQNVAHDY
jgi:hypothetical protein